MVKDGLSVHNAHFLALPYLVGLGSLAFICGVRLAWPAGYGSPPPVPFFPPVQNQLAGIPHMPVFFVVVYYWPRFVFFFSALLFVFFLFIPVKICVRCVVVW